MTAERQQERLAANHMPRAIDRVAEACGRNQPQDVAKKMASAIQAYLVNHTRLGIPTIVHDERCSGYLALGTTCFPQMISLARIWTSELAEQMTAVTRVRRRAVGARQGLSPVLDITCEP